MTDPASARAPQYQALILGGGDPGDPLAVSHSVAVKGLVPVAGEPMALHVLRAVRASGEVGRVAYIGPTTPEMDALIDLKVPDRGSLLDNLTAGLEALGDHTGRALVLTADIPMLTPSQLSDVLKQASAHPGAGLLYPVVTRQACEDTFPGVKRTFVRVEDGTFTGGNLFLFDPALVSRFLPRLRAILDARKAPLKLAALIGPGVLLRLLTGQLSVRGLEEAVSRLLGVQARAIITPHAAVGTDIDKPADLALAEAYLSQAH